MNGNGNGTYFRRNMDKHVSEGSHPIVELMLRLSHPMSHTADVTLRPTGEATSDHARISQESGSW